MDSPLKGVNWAEDRQWSSSWFQKQWVAGPELLWHMEVRSENLGTGTMRLGEICLRGSPAGTLKMSLSQVDWDTQVD